MQLELQGEKCPRKVKIMDYFLGCIGTGSAYSDWQDSSPLVDALQLLARLLLLQNMLSR